MLEPLANMMAFFITTSVVVLFFAVIPGVMVVFAGLLIGTVASLPILSVVCLTRLVKEKPASE